MSTGLPLSACLSGPAESLHGSKATTAGPIREHTLGQPAGAESDGKKGESGAPAVGGFQPPAPWGAERRQRSAAERDTGGGTAGRHSGGAGPASRTLPVSRGPGRRQRQCPGSAPSPEVPLAGCSARAQVSRSQSSRRLPAARPRQVPPRGRARGSPGRRDSGQGSPSRPCSSPPRRSPARAGAADPVPGACAALQRAAQGPSAKSASLAARAGAAARCRDGLPAAPGQSVSVRERSLLRLRRAPTDPVLTPLRRREHGVATATAPASQPCGGGAARSSSRGRAGAVSAPFPTLPPLESSLPPAGGVRGGLGRESDGMRVRRHSVPQPPATTKPRRHSPPSQFPSPPQPLHSPPHRYGSPRPPQPPHCHSAPTRRQSPPRHPAPLTRRQSPPS